MGRTMRWRTLPDGTKYLDRSPRRCQVPDKVTEEMVKRLRRLVLHNREMARECRGKPTPLTGAAGEYEVEADAIEAVLKELKAFWGSKADDVQTIHDLSSENVDLKADVEKLNKAARTTVARFDTAEREEDYDETMWERFHADGDVDDLRAALAATEPDGKEGL